MAFRQSAIGRQTRSRIAQLAQAELESEAVQPVPKQDVGGQTRSRIAQLARADFGPESQRRPLNIQPGVISLGTRLASRGRWYDSNLVRWSDGVMRAVGGWEEVTEDSFGGASTQGLAIGGTCTGVHGWAARDRTHMIAFGSAANAVYLLNGGTGVIRGLTLGGNIPFGSSVTGVNTWGMDNFGGDLVACQPIVGILRYVDTTVGQPNAPVLANAPTENSGVVVTPERFIVALGAGGDANKIQWCSQADATQWDPLPADSSAGDLDLPTQGRIQAGKRGRGETLIWTETDLIALRYLPSDLVYGATIVGRGGAASERAMIVSGSNAYWMGKKNFWGYNGQVSRIPCPVADYVFKDINNLHLDIIWAEKRDRYSEITWHYPSASSTVCDRYVTFNYGEGTWYFGQMARSGGVDDDIFDYPILIDNDGFLFYHEKGGDYGTSVPFAETGIIDIDEGLRNMYIDAIYPDENTGGDLTFTLSFADSPRGTYTQFGPFNASEEIGLRAEGRHLVARVEQASAGWRFGVPRIDARPAGER